MSVGAIETVMLHSKAEASDRLILMILANFADENGFSWPSMRTLAARSGLSKRAVQYALRRIESLGEVEVIQRFAEEGRQTSNGYKLLVRPPVQNLHPPGAADSIPPVQPTAHLEPSLEPKVERIPIRVSDLTRIWNENRGKMTECRLLTSGRLSHGLARLREMPDLDRWAAAVRRAAKSPFCRGEIEPTNGHRRFIGNIDWFLRPETLAKIEEGYYDDDGLARKTPKTFAEYLEATGSASQAEG